MRSTFYLFVLLLSCSFLGSVALAQELGEAGGLVIQPGATVTFGVGHPDADFNLPTKEVVGYPRAIDFLELQNGTYKDLLCTVSWDENEAQYAAFTSSVMNVDVYGDAVLETQDPMGCDCNARAALGCLQMGLGGCFNSTYRQRDIGGLRTCHCSCSMGGTPVMAACISGNDGSGTYKVANGDLISLP